MQNYRKNGNKFVYNLNTLICTLDAFLLANLNPDFVIENSIFCSFKD